MSTKTARRYSIGIAATCLSVAVLAACSSSGGSSDSGSTAAPAAAGASSSAATSGLRTRSTSIGTVTTDATGHTLYELVGDSAASPKCTGACLSVWPAAMVSGKQVVLQGHPAYTFMGDSAAGQVTGQGVKDQWGTWYALDGTGAPIVKAGSGGSSSAPSSSSSSSDSSGGGQYGY
ncbi:hypothetical protein [Jatrophihabitans sp.]|uniref:COG4315 family predicted lipoprotein n=1 Tax=Jatrophihabitans sp. TaxID=1932789 RepID=UPI0030C77F3D|nr:hypothetical protein [Jatrophihabitans sp.]